MTPQHKQVKHFNFLTDNRAIIIMFSSLGPSLGKIDEEEDII